MQVRNKKKKREASIFPLPKGYFSAKPIKKGLGEILKIFPITIHPDCDSRPCLFFEGFKFYKFRKLKFRKIIGIHLEKLIPYRFL